MSREEIIGLLGESSKKSGTKQPRAKPIATTVPAEAVVSPEPLSLDASQFWQGRGVPDDFFGEVRTPGVQAGLPRRLGNFPFWRGKERFLEALVPIYERSSPIGIEVLLGEGNIRLNGHSP
jgi:uncharacterized Zn finger protein